MFSSYKVTKSLILQSMKADSYLSPFDVIPLIVANKATLQAFIDLASEEAISENEKLGLDYLHTLNLLLRNLFKHRFILNLNYLSYLRDDPIKDKISEFRDCMAELKVEVRTKLLSDFAYDFTSYYPLPISEQIIIPPALQSMFVNIAPLFKQKRPRKDLFESVIDNPLPSSFTGVELLRYRNMCALPYSQSKPIKNLHVYGNAATAAKFDLNTNTSGILVPGGAAGALYTIVNALTNSEVQQAILITIPQAYDKFFQSEKYWFKQCDSVKTDKNNLLKSIAENKRAHPEKIIIVFLDETFSSEEIKKLNAKLNNKKDLVLQYLPKNCEFIFNGKINYALITTIENHNSQNRAGFIKARENIEKLVRLTIANNNWDTSRLLQAALEYKNDEHIKDLQCSHPADNLPSEEACVTDFFRDITEDKEVRSIMIPGGSTAALEMLLSQHGTNSIYITTAPTYRSLMCFNGKKLIINLGKEQGYKLSPEMLESTLINEKSTLENRYINFLLCNPGNPVGIYYSKHELEILYKILQKHYPNSRLILDLAHYDIYPTEEPVKVGVTSGENILTVYSISKTYGMAGARIGFIAGKPSQINELSEILPIKQGCEFMKVTAHCIFADDIKRRKFLAVNNEAFRRSADLLNVLVHGEKKANLPMERLKEIIEYLGSKVAANFNNKIDMRLLLQGLPGVEVELPQAGYMVLLSFPGWKDKKFKYQTKMSSFFSVDKAITIKNSGDIFLILSMYGKFVLPADVCEVKCKDPAVRITLTPVSLNSLKPDCIMISTFANLHEIAKKIGANSMKGNNIPANENFRRMVRVA